MGRMTLGALLAALALATAPQDKPSALQESVKKAREEGRARLDAATAKIKADAEASRKRAETLAKRIGSAGITVVMAHGARHEGLVPVDADLQALRGLVGGKDIVLRWDLTSDASVIDLARKFIDADPRCARDFGRLLASRRCWSAAKDALAAAAGDDEAALLLSSIDDFLSTEDVPHARAVDAGGDVVEITYRFDLAQETDDFRGGPGRKRENGALVLDATEAARWTLLEAQFVDQVDVTASWTGTGALLLEHGDVAVIAGPEDVALLADGKELQRAAGKGASLRFRRRGGQVTVEVDGKPALEAAVALKAGPVRVGTRGGTVRIAAPLSIAGRVDQDTLATILNRQDALAEQAAAEIDSLNAAIREETGHKLVDETNPVSGGDHVEFCGGWTYAEHSEYKGLRSKVGAFVDAGGYAADPQPGLNEFIRKRDKHPGLRYLLGLCLRHKSLGQGNREGAIASHDAALAIFPEFWEARLEVAEMLIERLGGRDIQRAMTELAKVLEARPDVAGAYALRAYLGSLLGDPKADADLRIARELGPQDPMVRRYRIRVQVAALGGDIGLPFTQKTKRHHLSTDISDSLAKKYAADLEVAFEFFRESFRDHYREPEPYAPPKVLIFKSRTGFNAYNWLTKAGRSENQAGHYDPGLNQLVLFKDSDEQETRHTLFHEAFHHVQGLVVRAVPRWYGEGMAEYFGAIEIDGGRVVKSGILLPASVRAVKERIAAATTFPFVEILQEDRQGFYNELQGAKYAQAWSMVHFFLHGLDGKYKGLLDAYLVCMKRSPNVNAAYDAVFKPNVGEIEKAWKKYVVELKD